MAVMTCPFGSDRPNRPVGARRKSLILGELHVVRVFGPYAIRRDSLDHVIVLNEAHFMRILKGYFAYYHESRTHQSLKNNAPIPRSVESPERGKVISIPQVGGLHHRYARAP